MHNFLSFSFSNKTIYMKRCFISWVFQKKNVLFRESTLIVFESIQLYGLGLCLYRGAWYDGDLQDLDCKCGEICINNIMWTLLYYIIGLTIGSFRSDQFHFFLSFFLAVCLELKDMITGTCIVFQDLGRFFPLTLSHKEIDNCICNYLKSVEI